MTYFTVLALAFGVATMLKPFYMHVLPWDERAFLAKTYARRRPPWVAPVAVLGLGVVLLAILVY